MKINKPFSKIKILFLGLMILISSGNILAQSTWKSPNYQKETYRKVIVLAKTSNMGAKRLLEDQTVAELMLNGILAIPAYSNFTDQDLNSEESFLAKANQLEADALLVYTFNPITTEYKNTASVNASLGVPVKVGIFRGFLGTNVPLAGGVKEVQKFSGAVMFYNRQSTDIQWTFGIEGKIGNDSVKQAKGLAKSTVKASLKDGIF